ncbi:MAG: ParB N-terminal domain-containing protein [Pseudomonadales bacterium]|nr:ParB N-terminal domain-containing protein [Pseudomonadales bacterium]
MANAFNKSVSTDTHEKTNAELRGQLTRLCDIDKDFIKKFPTEKILPIENYRKTFDEDKLKELGANIQRQGQLSPIGLIDNGDDTFEMIFGQRRFLAITKYTDSSEIEAFIWPKSAARFKETIALVENVNREDPSLDEEVAGMVSAIEHEFSDYESPIRAFSEDTGIPMAEISKKMKIGEAMRRSPEFMQIVRDKLVGDVNALYEIAQAIMLDVSEAKKKYLNKLLNLLVNNEFSGSLRKIASDVKKHLKSSGSKPNIQSVAEASENNAEKERQASAPKAKKPQTLKVADVTKFIEKLGNTDLTEELSNELKALDSLIVEKCS